MTSNVGLTGFLLVFVTSFALFRRAASDTYNVLETLGWIIPVFNVETGRHDVAEVSQEEYENCPATDQTSIIRQGPANINLTSICPHYFICTIGDHCQLGQKLTISITDDSATKTPSGLPPTSAYDYYSRQLCFTQRYWQFRPNAVVHFHYSLTLECDVLDIKSGFSIHDLCDFTRTSITVQSV